MGNILKYQNPSGPLAEPNDTTNVNYLRFKETLPDNLRLTPEKDYHMYEYWRLNGQPENFNQGKNTMFWWDRSDKGWHAGSIAEDKETGIYHFMKPKHHPTVGYELDWFNKGLRTLEGGRQVPVRGKHKKFWEDFTSKYQLDTTGVDYRYVPIEKKGGNIHIKKKNRGKFTDYCGGKVTQECIEKGKKSTNPTTRKRATFADNARKWKHQAGGKLIPRCQEGVGEGGFLRQLGKAIYGLTLPKYEGTFSEAFRQARINGNEKFRWNGEHYNTELAPNATIEALKQWDTKGDLAREEFKNQALRNPKDFFDFYSKGYPTHLKNHNFDALYGAARFYDNYAEKGTNHKLGSVVYSNLSDGWDEDKIAAAMGNSYVETGGWKQLTQIGGSAKGLFMMEKPERERYQAWLHKNGYTDDHANQVNYVQHLFDSRSASLKTPWDRLADYLPKANEIRKKYNEAEFKDVSELQKFVQGITTLSDADKYGVRSAWGHQDYSTDQAWSDWDSGNLDKKTKAFEALFERAGKPNMDRRYYLAHLIKKNQNIFRK